MLLKYARVIEKRAIYLIHRKKLNLVVSPDKILGDSHIENKYLFYTNGDWDLRFKHIEDSKTYKIMNALINGPGSDDYYKIRDDLIREFNSGMTYRNHNWKFHSEVDIDSYLFSRYELLNKIKDGVCIGGNDPIRVSVGRDLMLYKSGDGRHRISAAKILKKQINVRICHIHENLRKTHTLEKIIEMISNE